MYLLTYLFFTDLPTYLCMHLPYLLSLCNYLLTYLLTSLMTYILTYVCTYHTYLPTRLYLLSTYLLFTDLHTYLLTYLVLTYVCYLLTYISAYITSFLLSLLS